MSSNDVVNRSIHVYKIHVYKIHVYQLNSDCILSKQINFYKKQSNKNYLSYKTISVKIWFNTNDKKRHISGIYLIRMQCYNY